MAHLETRIQLAESRSMLADIRSQLTLQMVQALRNVLAERSRKFDTEFVAAMASMPQLSVPSEDELLLPSKLHSLLIELQKRGGTQ